MKGNVGSFVQFIDFSFPSIHKPFQTLMKDQIYIKWKICSDDTLNEEFV